MLRNSSWIEITDFDSKRWKFSQKNNSTIEINPDQPRIRDNKTIKNRRGSVKSEVPHTKADEE